MPTDSLRSIAPSNIAVDTAPTIAVPEWLYVRTVDALRAVMAGELVTESHREVLPALEQVLVEAPVDVEIVKA